MPLRTTFLLTLPAPHALVDTSQYSPFQADALHGAPATHSFCLFELPERRAAGADREEQLRILTAAGCVLMPAHRSPPLSCPLGTKDLHPSSMILSGGYQLTETCHLDTCRIIEPRFGVMQPFGRGTHLVEQVADRCCAGEGIVREHD
jgi:hypothetical protein